MIFLVAHLVQLATEAVDEVVEGRVGALGRDHRVARADQQTDEIAQQTIDSLTDQDITQLDAMMRGHGDAQVVASGVAVFPDLRGLFPHGGDGLGRGPEQAFIGAEAGAEGGAAGAFLLLGADEGDVGGEGVYEVCVAWSCHGGR